jgi:hypothetical protein
VPPRRGQPRRWRRPQAAQRSQTAAREAPWPPPRRLCSCAWQPGQHRRPLHLQRPQQLQQQGTGRVCVCTGGVVGDLCVCWLPRSRELQAGRRQGASRGQAAARAAGRYLPLAAHLPAWGC